MSSSSEYHAPLYPPPPPELAPNENALKEIAHREVDTGNENTVDVYTDDQSVISVHVHVGSSCGSTRHL